MKTTEEGLVLEVEGEMAKIKVGRHNDCKACGGCAGTDHIILDAVNKIDAQPGQRIAFEMCETSIVRGAFMVFVLPLIAAALGAFAGWQAGEAWGYDLVHAALVGGVIVFALSLVVVKLYDRSMARDMSMKPVIVKILS